MPESFQDSVARQILDAMEEERWDNVFAAKREVLERMAQEAPEEAHRGEAFLLDEAGWTERFSRHNPAVERLAEKAREESRQGKTVCLDQLLDSV